MEKINVMYKKSTNVFQKLKILPIESFLTCFIGFFIARVTLFNDLYVLGISYYVLLTRKKTTRWMGLLFTALGLFTSIGNVAGFKYLFILFMFAFIGAYLEQKQLSVTLIVQAIIGGIVVLLVGIITYLINQQTTYQLILNILESFLVFIMIYIYGKCLSCFVRKKSRSIYSQEEVISLMFLLGSAIVGLSDIYIYDIYLLKVICYFIVLLFGYKYGIGSGCSVGLTLGLFICIAGSFNVSEIVVLATMGLLAGLFKELGRVIAVLGFVVGSTLLGCFIYSDISILSILKPILISSLALILLPKRYLTIPMLFKRSKYIDQNEYIKRVQDRLSKRLKIFSSTFDSLSIMFKNISKKRTSLSKQELSLLLDEVAQRLCNKCTRCKTCWEDNFYYTYQAVYNVINAVESKGKISKKDIPEYFYKQCYNAEEFVKVANRIYEIYKLNLNWNNRLIENRMLVSEQLKGISQIINKLSDDVYGDIDFDNNLENEIMIALDKLDYNLKDVVVLITNNSTYEVDLMFTSFKQSVSYITEVEKTVSDILNRNMKAAYNVSEKKIKDHFYHLRLVEHKIFNVTTAKAILSKHECCGDNYTNFMLPDGHYLIAVSDGMGTGYVANQESTVVIEMLEKFMECGFDKNIALKMINSMLLLKSNDETFATLDMGVINLYTGVCEFVKIGGAAVFVIKDNEVSVIKSTSLPVGVLSKIDLEVYPVQLNHGDVIVMVTDGVFNTEEDTDYSVSCIKDILSKIESNNPQYIADYLLDCIKENQKEKIEDDITIIVSRIWKDRK